MLYGSIPIRIMGTAGLLRPSHTILVSSFSYQAIQIAVHPGQLHPASPIEWWAGDDGLEPSSPKGIGTHGPTVSFSKISPFREKTPAYREIPAGSDGQSGKTAGCRCFLWLRVTENGNDWQRLSTNKKTRESLGFPGLRLVNQINQRLLN